MDSFGRIQKNIIHNAFKLMIPYYISGKRRNVLGRVTVWLLPHNTQKHLFEEIKIVHYPDGKRRRVYRGIFLSQTFLPDFINYWKYQIKTIQ